MSTLAHDDDATPAEILGERYGLPNPHRNEFTLGDLGAGIVAGIALMLAIGITGGLALSWLDHDEIALVVAVAPFVSIPVLVAVGWPLAALAAWLLRPVPWEWLHVVAFGLLGAAASVTISAVFLGGVLFPPLVLLAMLYAVPSAVVARIFGRRAAIRRYARETTYDDAWWDDDDEDAG